MTMCTRKQHTLEQVVRKLTQADQLLAEGKALLSPQRRRATMHQRRLLGVSERFACRVIG
jgi:hypothetical protein